MRNVCCYGHAIGVQGGKCEAGHTQGISLRCQIENCLFATKPVTKSCMEFAKMRLENIHLLPIQVTKMGLKVMKLIMLLLGKMKTKTRQK